MRAHLQDLADVYGDSNLINLVNHKGHEKPIKEAFETYVEKVRKSFETWIEDMNELCRSTTQK